MNDDTELAIRIYHVNSNGSTEDAGTDFTLSELGGMVPSVGDVILDPGVTQGLNRYRPENREMLVVKKRVFNPRDLSEGVPPNALLSAITNTVLRSAIDGRRLTSAWNQ